MLVPDQPESFQKEAREKGAEHVIIEEKGSLDKRREDAPGTEVIVARYQLVRQGGNVEYYVVQPADTPVARVDPPLVEALETDPCEIVFAVVGSAP